MISYWTQPNKLFGAWKIIIICQVFFYLSHKHILYLRNITRDDSSVGLVLFCRQSCSCSGCCDGTSLKNVLARRGVIWLRSGVHINRRLNFVFCWRYANDMQNGNNTPRPVFGIYAR